MDGPWPPKTAATKIPIAAYETCLWDRPSILQVNMFYPDAEAVREWAYNSIDTTTQTTKYLIDAYYGRAAENSYFVGCSTSGRQGMAMSQRFPKHYDGVVAGDPFYLPPEISLDRDVGPGADHLRVAKGHERRAALHAEIHARRPEPVHQRDPGGVRPPRRPGGRRYRQHGRVPFRSGDFRLPVLGGLRLHRAGSALQCTGAKTATCLTPAQVNAAKKIEQGPRTSGGQHIVSPDGTLLSGYPFDGGFMQPSGIPTRDIGTATSPPGNIGLGSGQLPFFWFATPDPTYNPLTVNYDTDIGLVTPVAGGQQLDGHFPLRRPRRQADLLPWAVRLGSAVAVHVEYFHKVAGRFGGKHPRFAHETRGEGGNSDDKLGQAEDFMKLYLVPNMGHCGGNASTDRFDMLTPMVNWIENGIEPKTVVATGVNFSSTLGSLTGLPTTRSRPLCPYPQTLRYTGPKGGDISVAANYACVEGDFEDFR